MAKLTEKQQELLEANQEYWKDRTTAAQAKLTNKNIKAVNKQLRKYFSKSMQKVIDDFEATYDKLLAAKEEGKQQTPADLYKLDKYWQMQGQLQQELQKLGDKQAKAMGKAFQEQFFDIYFSIALPGKEAFTTINKEGAWHLINAIWCADGLDFSQRIWNNTELLIETLNEELIACVIAGKKTSELKKLLKERFEVSYGSADRIARTEMSHIQNAAAKQRYEDYGIKQMQVWADKDERRCDICGKLHKKKYSINEAPPVPVHPNCRCTIVPVVEI